MADNENLNEQVEVVVDDSTVITVPIDATLQNSGEAADAKAVGDALALKADKSELQTAITVNGQAADAQGAIIVDGTDIKMSDTDNTTIKAAIEAVDGKTAADIPVSNTPGAQTIKQALDSGATRTADQIEMSSTDNTSVKTAIETVAGDLDTLEETVAGLGEKTAADIKYQAGSNETIKQHVDQIDSGLVKSVNEIKPDPDTGNIDLERVPYADNLYTDDGTEVDAEFLVRTTGGSASLSDGGAWPIRILGNRVHTGYVAESLNMTVTPMERTAPAAITASITEATFLTKVDNTEGTYTFSHDGVGWSLDGDGVTISEYGITVSNTPIDGDEIIVVVAESGGSYTATMTVDAATRTAPAPITAQINRDTWVGEVENSGTYSFSYTTEWKLNNTAVDLADYGITVSNIPIAGDAISVVYVKEVRGTITQATPSRIVGTGWNLYNHTAGYARVVKYSNLYGYLVCGTYTALKFATTLDGEQTTITPDEDGLFNVTADGYVFVTGGNNTDTFILTTWSDWEEGYDGDFETYSESAISIASVMTANFPYGLCKIGTGANAVCDEIDFNQKLAINRISRVAYSEEARATAAASGRAYEFDENYIYQVRATPTQSHITLDDEYFVSEHGLEFFDGSSIPVGSEILYGSNLKDKLRRDVVTISKQTLTSGQKAQVRENIGAADETGTNQVISTLQDGIAYRLGNTNTTGATLNVGDYVYVTGNTNGVADGMYKVSTQIAASGSLTTSNLTAVSGGVGNDLNSKLTTQVTATVHNNSASLVTITNQNLYKIGNFVIGNIEFKSTASIPTGERAMFVLSEGATLSGSGVLINAVDSSVIGGCQLGTNKNVYVNPSQQIANNTLMRITVVG